jgi:NAD(P)-dependent dehydrogenase (short-subunit alcohol dehydrogenase family)
MSLRLKGAVTVVTGASSGIGRATALAFAQRGAKLVLAARRGELLEEVAQECRTLGAEAIAVPTDVADPDAVDRLSAEASARFGRIDIWVNNAAVLAFGSSEETPLDAYRRVFDINFFGCLHGSRAALSVFRDQQAGRLINVGSLFGRMAAAHVSAYISSKHAVLGLTRSLRQELALEPDIHVGAIVPAGVDTPILQHAANFTGIRVRALYPLTTAQDAADAVLKMASRPQREMFVGRAGRVHDALQRRAPETHDRIAGWATQFARRRADEWPTTTGNLFEPVEEGRGASGGIRKPRVAARKIPLYGVAALALGREFKRRR